MFLNSANILFLSSSIFGIFLATSSSSWLAAWIGLELNLLSFVPLITSKKDQYSSESALKYFLIQALASAILILAALMVNISPFCSLGLITSSLLIKTGSAPFHFWFPAVIQGLAWPQTALLMTLQKISPMVLLSYTLTLYSPLTQFLFFISITSSAIFGALGGLNQTLLRKLMAYSSINHMAWMLSAMLISELLWLQYFLFYCLISVSIISIFYSTQSYHTSNLIFKINFSSMKKSIFMFSLLSLGGLPPFTGFLPKWIVIQELANHHMFLPLTILLVSTLLTLYYYLSISVGSFLLSSSKTLSYYNLKYNIPTFLTYFNFMALLVPSFIFLFIS
uniref:NADH dehydrogenase subunit 2 n=1 Tax=Allanaspides helonomus TaxID=91997 RepID=UPI002A8099D0|nr:NADH dehydrogenase subunit 2 [Allanaspides helonomus]WOR80940.1 NADH dehydrogenase subunit 2 [Allanaspides helonomus]WOR80953.1 NADH dehydrogenase subunit 2 [Allanaspides helonomus]